MSVTGKYNLALLKLKITVCFSPLLGGWVKEAGAGLERAEGFSGAAASACVQ